MMDDDSPRPVRLIYLDGSSETKEAGGPHPLEIFIAASKCGKVKSRRFVFDADMTKQEGMIVYLEV
jgi:hypothetical protein